MIFDLFTSVIKLFQRHQKEKIGHESDMVHIRKRQLLHKNIPDLDSVKAVTGKHFYALQEIFNRFDPVKADKLSEYPNKYELLTRTVIYKLPKQKTKEALADMVYVEFSLWFKHGYHEFTQKDELIDEIYNFKKQNFITEPFSRQE